MPPGFERWVAIVEYGDGVLHVLSLIALCSLRMLAIMLILPATDSSRLPGQLRAVLPICLGLYIGWGQDPGMTHHMDATTLAVLLLKEALIGLLIGFAASSIFWVAEGVGSMIDNMAGYNNVQQSNPQSSDQHTPIGRMLSELATFAFWMLGGMVALVDVLFLSYEWWPLGATWPSGAVLLEKFVQAQVSQYIASVAKIAAPVMLTLLMIDIGVGLLTKTAEKLEANSLGQPIKGAVALLLVSLLLGMFFQQFKDAFALLNFSAEFKMLVGR